MLNINWKPEFGLIYTWFASDKNGKVAMFVNNCFGDIPKVVLAMPWVEERLDELSEFIFEDDFLYEEFFFRKKGEVLLDFYSSWRYQNYSAASEIYRQIQSCLDLNLLNEKTLPAFKGVYVYHAVEGSRPGEDYPVGFEGESQMGDYFRYLYPTVLADINEFPQALRRSTAKSMSLDFSKDRFIRNSDLNLFFDCICS